jgi:hypothetical protein
MSNRGVGFLPCGDWENNSSTVAVQVVKGDQNGYPMPGGIAGPPCPGVINEVDWTSRLGEWPTVSTTCHSNNANC